MKYIAPTVRYKTHLWKSPTLQVKIYPTDVPNNWKGNIRPSNINVSISDLWLQLIPYEIGGYQRLPGGFFLGSAVLKTDPCLSNAFYDSKLGHRWIQCYPAVQVYNNYNLLEFCP